METLSRNPVVRRRLAVELGGRKATHIDYSTQAAECGHFGGDSVA